MRRRDFLKYSAATAMAGSIGYRAARADAPAIKVGVVGAKTGPLAPGAASTIARQLRTLIPSTSGRSHSRGDRRLKAAAMTENRLGQ